MLQNFCAKKVSAEEVTQNNSPILTEDDYRSKG